MQCVVSEPLRIHNLVINHTQASQPPLPNFSSSQYFDRFPNLFCMNDDQPVKCPNTNGTIVVAFTNNVPMLVVAATPG